VKEEGRGKKEEGIIANLAAKIFLTPDMRNWKYPHYT
jgi:hypothetical protein